MLSGHQVACMGKRLTEEDKRKIEVYAGAHPDPTHGRVISVTVRDEIDDDGKVRFITNYAKETTMPRGWKP
jgi:hypothetical protein